jgi:4-hydroxy-4-methyl-2-oxoglutarate aldolase
MKTPPMPPEFLELLRHTPTSDVADALDLLRLRLPNEGYAGPNLRRLTPGRAPLIGHAVTLCVRSAEPSMDGRPYFDRPDWWAHLAAVPPPRVVVIEERDRGEGRGAFVGAGHAAVLQAAGCIGVITNGLCRRIPAVAALGFQVFAGGVCPSHAFAHVIEAGGRVEVEGIVVGPGDWLHADSDGILTIPPAAAAGLPDKIRDVQTEGNRLRAFCRRPGITPEELSVFLAELKRPAAV